jgi:hypothetical protein
LAQEEQELLRSTQRALAKYYVQQKKIVEQEQQFQADMRSSYSEEVDRRKQKFRVAQRQQNRNQVQVLRSLKEYGSFFFHLQTDDSVLFEYQRKIRVELQKDLLKRSLFGVATGLALYQGAGRLRKHGTLALPLYFMMPVAAWLVVRYHAFQKRIFEIGYPAHPLIVERRRKCVNETCFFAPSVLKHEIEFLHSKIDGIKTEQDLAERLLSEKRGESANEARFEREFNTAQLHAHNSLLGRAAEGEGKRFKIIVDHGELFLECLDPFEEIFELSPDLLQGLELTDVLSPHLFDNHRHVVNALFEVYFDLGEEYLAKFFDEAKAKQLQTQAREKVEKRFGIGRFSQLKGNILLTGEGSQERHQVAQQELSEVQSLLKDNARNLKRPN